jgi:cation diffusion facilitator family transporter
VSESPHTTETARRKEEAALLSIIASAGLTLAKLAAGLLSGSLALVSEGGHALLDTGATTLTFFAVRAANKPADEEHHYGHGKIEAVSALAETGLLFALAVAVVVAAVHRLLTGDEGVEANWPAFAVLLASIGVDLLRWRGLAKIAHDTKSEALAADALHFSSDLVSSILVLLGLIAARFGYPQGDAAAAIGVALFIVAAGYRLGRRTIDTLVDTAPSGFAARIRLLVESVPGVESVDRLRLRPTGGAVTGELSISVARTLPLERVAEIKDRVSSAIAAEMPETTITVTANPTVLDRETVVERVLLVSARRRLPVHHVTVQEIGARKSVSLDVELDGRMRLGEAHEIASSLERAIAAELGPTIEVETHIEPLATDELAGADSGPEQRSKIAAALARRAAQGDALRDIHNVRVRETSAGLVVNYHCRVDPMLTVDEVHEAVDVLDHLIRADFPSIARVVGHAEPMKA